MRCAAIARCRACYVVLRLHKGLLEGMGLMGPEGKIAARLIALVILEDDGQVDVFGADAADSHVDVHLLRRCLAGCRQQVLLPD